MNASTTVDLETAYVNPAHAQEYQAAIETWARDAAAYRIFAGGRACLDVHYGDKARQQLDIFTSEKGADAPLALFLHGGYWQSMDKSYFSHMARGLNQNGITVAIAGYTLCPEATVAEIVVEIRQAVAFLTKRFEKPVIVYGHSAGGHLSACMLATDWRAEDPSLPANAVPAGFSISGIFDLEPLVSTSLNHKLGLSIETARRLSPIWWKVPNDRSMISYVGENESSEFLRQSRDLVTRWNALGVTTLNVEVCGATHFSIIAPLADPESSMTQDLVGLAKGK